MTFMAASPPLARALAERNYDQPTPVQRAVLADDAVGRDLLVSAQTGSGKTVAYGLAIAGELLDDAERFERAAAPLALIPSRRRGELAATGASRTGMALSICRSARGLLRRRQQIHAASSANWPPAAHRGRHTWPRLCDHLRRGRLDVSPG